MDEYIIWGFQMQVTSLPHDPTRSKLYCKFRSDVL